MSFEKLKISVMVSLVLFIFIVGNVFAFGYLQKVHDTGQLKNNDKNTKTDLNMIVADTKKNKRGMTPRHKITTIEESPKKDKSTSLKMTTQTTVTHTAQKTIKHHRRTHAS